MEIWKTIPGWENYQVSNQGRYKSLNYNREKREKVKHLIKTPHGYVQAQFSKNNKIKNILMHRLVYLVFNGIPLNTKLCVLHKNDIRDDNRLDNLFIGTQQDNIDDMFKKGRQGKMYGEHSKINKLMNEDVLEICEMLDDGVLQKTIAKQFSIKKQTVSDINVGRKWNHLTNRYGNRQGLTISGDKY